MKNWVRKRLPRARYVVHLLLCASSAVLMGTVVDIPVLTEARLSREFTAHSGKSAKPLRYQAEFDDEQAYSRNITKHFHFEAETDKDRQHSSLHHKTTANDQIHGNKRDDITSETDQIYDNTREKTASQYDRVYSDRREKTPTDQIRRENSPNPTGQIYRNETEITPRLNDQTYHNKRKKSPKPEVRTSKSRTTEERKLQAQKTELKATKDTKIQIQTTTSTVTSIQTPPHYPLRQDQIASRFRLRKHILRSACRFYSDSPLFRPENMTIEELPLYKPVMTLSTSFCPIPDTLPMSLAHIFGTIRKEMGARNITGTRVDVPPGKRDVLFTFVRESYGRLLSAYIDKLFSPFPQYWRRNGLYIVKDFRHKPSSLSLFCGHDVTFPEFIKDFIRMQTTGLKRSGHYISAHDYCQMCDYPYKYIGHLETIKDDIPFIMKAIRSPVTFSYDDSSDSATISGNVKTALKTMRSGVQGCINLDEACRRLWKTWQIGGIISKTESFPLNKKQTSNITREEFEAAAMAALGRSGEKTSRLRQRKEALREAYASVPLGDRLEVKKLLFLDFKMFGFDPEPEEVFPTSTDSHDDFSYFDLYK